ncbi:BMP family ABC transporter substrate-binding protein [Microbacterium barkeri]|uniref:BMP family ABC transporter substrate-binding protein n=1 Tax=Microbacterium barkeri TaxID=33917 RepID=A0A9W6H512_9MICO|nr:BMP family ABC transporter substrate-binding protein [Microbacterium barkeri]MDI6944738.1 BMP family ABC transporter substrate-binding protein [Microbacterium barkeri]MDR6875073.1 basic membrane protein A [Microbacterium barkeri]GLJ62762.1 BMP family ABC transporter substrate-binding protein [Microbacterium barkeri]
MSRIHRTGGLALAVGVVSALALTGCSGASTAASSDSADGAFTYALVTPGAAGDGGYIDSSIAGAKLAEEQLGVTGRVVEAESVSQQESVLRSTVATHPDIILAPGLDPDSLLAVAEENPDQLFGVPSDIFVDELPDNVQAYSINVNESSFLGGYVAGAMTTTKKVGAVLGGDNPGINQFFYGFKQGVLAACADCVVTPSYLNNEYSDPSVGQEAALALYQDGNDIVYAVAGLSGQGVFTAAEQEGKYAIGVDSNQDGDAPGTVITSVMKRVDMTTFNLIKSAMDGEFQSGFVAAGMADGVSGLSWDDESTVFADNGPADMVALLPDVQAKVAELSQQILDGQIEVCDALNDATSDQCAALGLSS